MSGTRVPASEDTQGVIGATGRLDNDVLIFTCVAPRTKKCHFADFLHKSTTGSTCTCAFFLYDIPSLCHNFSHTFDPKMHHPAMDS